MVRLIWSSLQSYTLCFCKFLLKAWSSWMLKESLQLCNRAPNGVIRFCSCSENQKRHFIKDSLSASQLMVELIWSSLQSYRLLFCSFFFVLEDPVVIGATQREYSFVTCPKSITIFISLLRVRRVLLLIWCNYFSHQYQWWSSLHGFRILFKRFFFLVFEVISQLIECLFFKIFLILNNS